jgi:glycosyltransferase 2 family protein
LVRRSRRSALLAAAVVVTVVFGYFAVRDVEPEQVADALREANLWWLLPALLLLAVSLALRALRWRYLFAPETRPPLGPVTASMLVGLALNNLLPLRAGEAARIVALNRATQTSRAEILSTVALERALDVLCLLLLLFVALPFLPEVSWVGAAAVLALVVALGLAVVMVVLALFGERPVRAVLRPLARFRFLHPERLEHVADNLVHGLAGLRRRRLAFAGVAWTTLSWVLLSVSFWLVTLCFDLDLPVVSGLLVLTAVGLSLVLPAGPASVGVFEAAVIVALGAYDVPRADALTYAIVLHALNFFPYLIAGAVAVGYTRPRR